MSKDLHQDPLDELLRRHLLEQGDNSEGGENLLNQTSDQVFNTPPLVIPDTAKEQAMLGKLKAAFPETPGGGPGSGGGGGSSAGNWLAKWPFMALAGATVAIVVALLMAGPGTNDPQNNNDDPLISEGGGDPVVSLSDTTIEDGLGGQVEYNFNDDPSSEDNQDRMGSTGVSGLMRSINQSIDRFPFQDLPNPTPVDLPSPLLNLFAENQVPGKYYTFMGNQDFMLTGPKGTLLHFTPNSFLDDQGNVVSGKIRLELKEVLGKKDILLSNVPTLSNGQVLESGGMVFLDATHDGFPIHLRKGKDILVEFPSYGNSRSNMELFAGNYDPDGHMNWEHYGGVSSKMIPLPITEIKFSQFMSPTRGHKEWDKLMTDLNHPKFQNTWIATREFVERLMVARRMGYVVPIIEMYMDNVNIEMYRVDRMVSYYMRGDYRNYEYKETGSMSIEDFDGFALEGMTNVIPFDNHGLNLDAADAHMQLMAKGYSGRGADEMLRTHRFRKKILSEINGAIEVAEKNGNTNGNFAQIPVANGQKAYVWANERNSWSPRKRSRAFAIKMMGWTNLDRFVAFGVKDSGTRLVINPEYKTEPENTRTWFVFQNRRSVIEIDPDKDGKAVFRNIPKGSKGHVVTIGYQDGIPWFGKSTVKVDSKTEIDLAMEMVSDETIKDQLAFLGN